MQSLELTLIVAATRNMGIGAHGTMPWSGLRQEMCYFARVTSRVPPQVWKLPSYATFASGIYKCRNILSRTKADQESFWHQSPSTAINAVIMGRKTWDSIPLKFRPLKDRLNIVVTRSAPATPPPGLDPKTDAVRVPSMQQALEYAQTHNVARIFIMGGAQIYDAALKLPQAKRILLTSIQRDFDCDTFFPVELMGDKSGNWEKKPREALEQWTGEEIAEGGQVEADTQYEFQLWEKDEASQ